MRWNRYRGGVLGCLILAIGLTMAVPRGGARAETDDLDVALSLANMLRAARAVISSSQELINDPAVGDKGLSGEVVVTQAIAAYGQATGKDPLASDPESRQGKLLRAQLASITEVMDENQATINRKDLGFKGFVPAVFARLVNERFKEKVGNEAEIKVTAPPALIRNRKARPDSWETELITDKLMSSDWPKGQLVSAEAANEGRKAFRVLVPEYYGAGCLACHGEPQGEIDVTGYPKEGGKLDDLGGVISITLFR